MVLAFQRTVPGSSYSSATPGMVRDEASVQPTSGTSGVPADTPNDLSDGSFAEMFADDLTSDGLSPYDRFLASQEAATSLEASQNAQFGLGSYTPASVRPSGAVHQARPVQTTEAPFVSPSMQLAAAPTFTTEGLLSPSTGSDMQPSVTSATLVSPQGGLATPPAFVTGTLVSSSQGSTPTPSYTTGPLVSNASTGPQDSANSAIALGADVASSLYGVTGANLKIGVISNSFNATGGGKR